MGTGSAGMMMIAHGRGLRTDPCLIQGTSSSMDVRSDLGEEIQDREENEFIRIRQEILYSQFPFNVYKVSVPSCLELRAE